MARKKQIQPSILADEKKIAEMMEKNTAARQFTDEYKIYVENFKLGFKGRKITGLPGKKDWFWDFAYRPNGQNPVHIIAKDEKTKKYLLIMQPRAPFEGKRFILSFPAGLKDIKNGAPEPALDTAIRELKEETGYAPIKCEIISPHPLPKSAGMTTECAEVAYAVVDPKGVNRPDNEATEDIVSLWITADEFKALVPKLAKNIMIEYDLMMFMMGKSY